MSHALLGREPSEFVGSHQVFLSTIPVIEREASVDGRRPGRLGEQAMGWTPPSDIGIDVQEDEFQNGRKYDAQGENKKR